MNILSNFKSAADTWQLNNGYKIPCIGFGTWQLTDGEVAEMAVNEAIKNGYRHFDCASHYNNEVSIGKALKKSNIKREDLFITGKVWNTERGYEKSLKSFEETCRDLDVDYLDLYLIHWPANEKMYPNNWEEINIETWEALIKLYKKGQVKSIGVSNFMPHHLEALMKTEIKPMVNQIEFHPGLMWQETVDYCNANEILVEAWSPLGTGSMLSNEMLLKIASKYKVSTAQLCIRWVLQHGIIPLPKSATPLRIRGNTLVFDFEISDEDMKLIDGMNYFGGSGLHPDEVRF